MLWLRSGTRWCGPVIIHLAPPEVQAMALGGDGVVCFARSRKTQEDAAGDLLLLLTARLIMILLALAIARPSSRGAGLGNHRGQTNAPFVLFVIDQPYRMAYKRATKVPRRRQAAEPQGGSQGITHQREGPLSILPLSNYTERSSSTANARSGSKTPSRASTPDLRHECLCDHA